MPLGKVYLMNLHLEKKCKRLRVDENTEEIKMNASNKRAREEGTGGNGHYNDQFTFERMKQVKDVLFYRDKFDFTYIEQVVEELKRFLILKTIYGDMDATLLSPSPKVDHAWHVLLELPQVLNYHFNILIFPQLNDF